MSFLKGQEVIYTSVGGTKEKAKIILRKIDFENGRIEIFNIKGGEFEYLISVERSGKRNEVLCLEKELS